MIPAPRWPPAARLAATASGAAVACALSFSAAFALAQPPKDTGVLRQKAKSLRLDTQMGSDVQAYLYAPPAAAPGPGGQGTSGQEIAGREPTGREASGQEAAGQASEGPGGTEASERPLPVVYLSGEWGWTPMLQDTASYLALKGRHVLAIDATSYFRKMIDGPAMARDLETFRARVNEAAGNPMDSPVLLAGFAYGATMIPYVLNRAGVRGIQGTLMVGPGDAGATVYRVAIQLKMAVPGDETFSVSDEVRRLPMIPAVIIEGDQDDRSKGRSLFILIRGPRKYVPIAGADHQFNQDRRTYYQAVAASLAWLERPGPRPEPREFAMPARPAVPGRALPGGAGPGIGGSQRPLPRPAEAPTPSPTPGPP